MFFIDVIICILSQDEREPGMTHNSHSLLVTLCSQWSLFSIKQMSHMRFVPFGENVSPIIWLLVLCGDTGEAKYLLHKCLAFEEVIFPVGSCWSAAAFIQHNKYTSQRKSAI